MMFFVVLILLYLIWRGGELLALIARMIYYKYNQNKGLKLYQIAVKIGTMSANTKITYGYLALRHGYVDEAKKIVSAQLARVKRQSEIIAAKTTLALVYWKLDDLDRAIELLEDVLEYGENTVAYGSLGHMYNLRNNDLKAALIVCKNAYNYNPNDDIITDNYATILYKTGNIAKAKEIYKELAKREPTFPEAYYNYAHLLIDEGNIKEAVKQLKTATKSKYTFLTTLKLEDVQKELSEYENQIK